MTLARPAFLPGGLFFMINAQKPVARLRLANNARFALGQVKQIFEDTRGDHTFRIRTN